MRIIDQPFPADGRARFFEIGSHHNQEPIAQAVGDGLQLRGVFVRGLRVMDGAGADNHEEPFTVLSMKNPADGLSGFDDKGGRLVGDGKLSLNGARGRQRLDFNDVLVINRSIHRGPLVLCGSRRNEIHL